MGWIDNMFQIIGTAQVPQFAKDCLNYLINTGLPSYAYVDVLSVMFSSILIPIFGTIFKVLNSTSKP
jgi:hypothetical protein